MMEARKVFMLWVLILAGSPLIAQMPEPEFIMNRSRELTVAGDVSARIILSITEKSGSVRVRTITMSTKSFGNGIEKRLIRFIDPPDVKGTSMLIFDHPSKSDEMWIYLPALKRTRRIISSEKGKSFMNSEFTNADMSSPAVSDFVHRHADESGKTDYYIIESTPASQDLADQYAYSKKISFIRKDVFQVSRMEFYNFDNVLFKIIEIKNIYAMPGGKYIVSDMYAHNLSNNRKSQFVMDDITTGAAVNESVFTLQNLER